MTFSSVVLLIDVDYHAKVFLGSTSPTRPSYHKQRGADSWGDAQKIFCFTEISSGNSHSPSRSPFRKTNIYLQFTKRASSQTTTTTRMTTRPKKSASRIVPVGFQFRAWKSRNLGRYPRPRAYTRHSAQLEMLTIASRSSALSLSLSLSHY